MADCGWSAQTPEKGRVELVESPNFPMESEIHLERSQGGSSGSPGGAKRVGASTLAQDQCYGRTGIG